MTIPTLCVHLLLLLLEGSVRVPLVRRGGWLLVAAVARAWRGRVAILRSGSMTVSECCLKGLLNCKATD